MRKHGTFCRHFFLFFVLMLFLFASSLISPVFSKHHRIPFSWVLFFPPKEILQLLLLMKREKKSKHHTTMLRRNRLTWQLTKNTTNYPSSCRYAGFRRKLSRELLQTLSVPHLCPLGLLEVTCRLADNLLHTYASYHKLCSLSEGFPWAAGACLTTSTNRVTLNQGGGDLKEEYPRFVGYSWGIFHTLSKGPSKMKPQSLTVVCICFLPSPVSHPPRHSCWAL